MADICEDRGIEHYAFLQSLVNGERIYPRLVKHFRDAGDGSQLTAHSPRPSKSGPSAVSRKPMAEVPGQVYEQFLGKVTRLTAERQAKVEGEPESPASVRVPLTRACRHSKRQSMLAQGRPALMVKPKKVNARWHRSSRPRGHLPFWWSPPRGPSRNRTCGFVE